MRRNQIDGWTTKDEIFFLENIGKFSNLSRLYYKNEILRNYLAAAEKRTDWDTIDKDRVIRFAENMMVGSHGN